MDDQDGHLDRYPTAVTDAAHDLVQAVHNFALTARRYAAESR